MIITNPLTGQVLNANPEGHNQYFNPDGTVRPTTSGKMTRFRKLIDRLSKSATKAGKKLYGDDLLNHPHPMFIRRQGLQDRIEDEDTGLDSYGDFEYAFNPSTGKGYEASGEDVADTPKTWKDKKGRVYTYASEDDSINVVDPKFRGTKEFSFEKKKVIRRKGL